MVRDQSLVERFAADLDALIAPDQQVGLAVSGGPDSIALLLLAAAARPKLVQAATVDHGIRAESRDEAEAVMGLCARIGIPHSILTVGWDKPPETAIQEKARTARYRLLGWWAKGRGVGALLTAHHADDQAETLMMRLSRGAGVRGLAGMRPASPAPFAAQTLLLRPLLGWRRRELERICAEARITPVQDPSNGDEAFERVRMRSVLAQADWLPVGAIARSAANLAAADEAIEWATDEEWSRNVSQSAGEMAFDPNHSPIEIRRRVVARILAQLAAEGPADEFRGRELDRVLAQMQEEKTATLRGVRCTGGQVWRFAVAPPRRAR